MVRRRLVGASQEHGVLRRRVDGGLDEAVQIGEAVDQRAVYLRPGTQTEEVLKVNRLDPLCHQQVRHMTRHEDRSGERGHGPDRTPHRLEIALQSDPGQGANGQSDLGKTLQVIEPTTPSKAIPSWHKGGLARGGM